MSWWPPKWRSTRRPARPARRAARRRGRRRRGAPPRRPAPSAPLGARRGTRSPWARRAVQHLAGDLADPVLVGRHLAADHGQPEPPARVDRDRARVAAHRVAGEHDARHRGVDHAAGPSRPSPARATAEPLPVGDGLGIVEARPAVADRVANAAPRRAPRGRCPAGRRSWPRRRPRRPRSSARPPAGSPELRVARRPPPRSPSSRAALLSREAGRHRHPRGDQLAEAGALAAEDAPRRRRAGRRAAACARRSGAPVEDRHAPVGAVHAQALPGLDPRGGRARADHGGQAVLAATRSRRGT